MATPLTTRETIRAALDLAVTTRADAAIDAANEAAAETVAALLHRRYLRPTIATHHYPWPHPDQRSTTWRLWLDADPLLTVTTLTVGGETVTPGNYYLEPANSGGPYNRVELNRDGTPGGWASSATGSHQRAVTITGLWGLGNTERPGGALNGDTTANAATIGVTNAAAVGVGDVLRVDAERVIVTDRAWVDTGVTTTGGLTAAVSDNTVTVSNPAGLNVGEPIRVDTETMTVTDINTATSTVTISRARDGSTLTTHTTGTEIWAPRTLTVTRGALGTTAAAHLDTTAVAVHVVPSLVHQLGKAEALVNLGLEWTQFAGQAGTGEAGHRADTAGGGIDGLRWACRRAHGRKARFR